jgi:hypothetical protein
VDYSALKKVVHILRGELRRKKPEPQNDVDRRDDWVEPLQEEEV